MYFNCSTLKTTMKVDSCAEYRARPANSPKAVLACVGCTKWQTETTNPANLQTQEQLHALVLESVLKPLPVRFNRAAEAHRIRTSYDR
jgi:hypothetical protein